jgi:hypothetical protein
MPGENGDPFIFLQTAPDIRVIVNLTTADERDACPKLLAKPPCRTDVEGFVPIWMCAARVGPFSWTMVFAARTPLQQQILAVKDEYGNGKMQLSIFVSFQFLDRKQRSAV